MSAPVKQDAAFRWVENGQSQIHYLGAKLFRPTSDGVQYTSEFVSEDLATIRRVSVPMSRSDLRATIRFDGQPEALDGMISAGRRGAPLEYYPAVSDPSFAITCRLMDAGPITTDATLWWHPRYEVDVHLRATSGTWEGVISSRFFQLYKDANGFYYLDQDAAGQAYGLAKDVDGFYYVTALETATHHFVRDRDGFVRPVAIT